MNKRDIIYKAIDALKVETNFKADYHLDNINDDIATITFNLNEQQVKFQAEIRIEVKTYQIEALENKARVNPNFIIIAEHIYPAVKNKLRELGIAYMDTEGNIFIKHEKLFVLIQGNKKNDKENKTVTTNRAFTKTGLKTVFYLLLNPNAIAYTYRTLAGVTNVALGNVKHIIDGLKDAGYVLNKDEKKLILTNKRELLERWIDGYKETLKPSLEIGKYKHNEQIEKDIEYNFNDNQITIGGEYAAELVTEYLKAAQFTLYTDMPKLDTMRALKLIPDNNGSLVIYKKFWKNEFFNIKNLNLAPLLLIYADLMITNDPRCKETALKIYNKYLKNEFE